MKFGIRIDLYVMLVSSCEFLGSRCSNGDTTWWHKLNFAVFFSIVFFRFGKKLVRRCSQNLLYVTFMKIGAVSHSSLRGVK